jgi:transposase
MSDVVYLREELRLPVNLVQRYLERAKLLVSSGEIEWICTEVAEHFRPIYEGYVETLQGGEIANMDETGMRIDGENRWLLAGVAKEREPEIEAVVFHHDEHRSSAVVDELLGEEFSGVMGTDFYSAYNPKAVRKQRCWAHLLRETGKLKEKGEEG